MHEPPPSSDAFIGRERELAVVAACADAAAQRSAQVVWLEGEAGTGKTALVRRSARDLGSRFTLLRAEADELSQDVSYAMMNQLGVANAANPFTAGLALVERLAMLQSVSPVALIVEDLQWCDPASRIALLTAARRLQDDAVLMMVTSRPFLVDEDWARFSNEPERCVRVALGGFDDGDVAALARRSGMTLTRRQAERLRHHTLGHPLYVQTLLRELSPTQLTAADGELPAPRSLALGVTAALAALPPDSRALAAALAVLARPTALATVARVAGVDSPSAALEPLLRTGFVAWHPSADQMPVEFTHPLYRAAVYDDLSPDLRRDLHLASSSLTLWGPSWAHRIAAADGPDATLCDELVSGAEYEVARSDLSLAATYLTWAAGVAPSVARADELHLRSARLFVIDGQASRAVARLPRLLECERTALRELVLGSIAFALADAGEAERRLAGVGDAEPHNESNRQLRGDALAELALLYALLGRAADTSEAATRALANGPFTDPRIDRNAWWGLSIGDAMLGGAPRGLAQLSRRLPDSATDVTGEDSELLVARGLLRMFAGTMADAITDLRTAIDLARGGYVLAQLPRAHLMLAHALFRSGAWDESLVQARTVQSLVDDSRTWMPTQAESSMTLVLAARGDWDAARRYVDHAADVAVRIETIEMRFTAATAAAALGHAQGNDEAVIAALDPFASEQSLADGAVLTMLMWWPQLISSLISAGHVERAAIEIERFADAATAADLRVDTHLADLRGRLALALGDTDGASASFELAFDSLTPDHPMLDRLLLMREFGRVLRSAGQRRRSEDLLRAAHSQFDQLGAAPYRDLLEEDLREGGTAANPKRARQPFTLTPRETDVAVLVKQGLTNKEVAAALYISTKAVEYHLSKVYGKLSITSRRELRAVDL